LTAGHEELAGLAIVIGEQIFSADKILPVNRNRDVCAK
jgi:hypothetical protein